MLHTKESITASAESVVAQIWYEVLGAKPISPDTSFFDAGGNSLAAAKLMIRVEDVFGEDALPPEALYAQPTFAEIVATVSVHAG